ncbi:hypothetical protein Mth01_44040 [Sphaerimonospora thailandensis]|uniref:Uncharacterized protein n=1 Tax=Sphaerimonospora thailandensis TaxID=795644 RepID=A0A8J3W1V0_9ACTN|nr:hypothetical protein Mth01_44040 [Sphaerimonospora thailandensis]
MAPVRGLLNGQIHGRAKRPDQHVAGAFVRRCRLWIDEEECPHVLKVNERFTADACDTTDE